MNIKKMTEKLKETIKEELAELPKEMQNAINAFDWVKIAEEIGEKHSLDENEINNFQLETLLVLVGATDPEFYAINIENQVETTNSEAESISDEVFKKIFNPINNLIIENIKKTLQGKNSNWVQTLDFILSGGDYSVFLEKYDDSNVNSKDSEMTILDRSRKIEDIKSKFVI